MWPPGFQAGFLVARRDPTALHRMVDIVKEGNYSEGWGYGCGWGNLGYAGWVRAMDMQGLVAYYYDHIDTHNAVELNQCLFSYVGVDMIVRGKYRNIKKPTKTVEKQTLPRYTTFIIPIVGSPGFVKPLYRPTAKNLVVKGGPH